MKIDKALALAYDACERAGGDPITEIDSDALDVLIKRASSPLAFTDDEVATIADFAGLPDAKVRGLFAIAALKARS